MNCADNFPGPQLDSQSYLLIIYTTQKVPATVCHRTVRHIPSTKPVSVGDTPAYQRIITPNTLD
jgi:hypothetical protein